MSSISNNSLSSYLQTLLNNQLQTPGLANQQTNSSSINVSPLEPQQSDGGQLSQFAQVVSALENLQESNPAQYQQVTGQIATNLQQAAQTALSDGNSSAANNLSQLATAFGNASQSGQLPQFQSQNQDPGQSSGQQGSGHTHGAHHHHHHHGGSSSSTDGDGTTATATNSTVAGSTSANSTNPLAIIFNTLQNAGLISAQRPPD